jgi:hypothetical protein
VTDHWHWQAAAAVTSRIMIMMVTVTAAAGRVTEAQRLTGGSEIIIQTVAACRAAAAANLKVLSGPCHGVSHGPGS